MPEKHHLRYNPFREARHDHDMIGRKDEMKKVFNIVEESLEDKSPAMFPVLGPYGMGKTFTLLQLKALFARDVLFRKKRKILTAYLTATREKFPSKYAHYVYTNVIDDIGPDGLSRLLEELQKAEEPPEKLLETIRENDFKNALLSFGKEDNKHIVWSWMRGGTIPPKKVTGLSIYSKISGDEEARRVMLDFCRFLHALEYDGLVVLMDELEQAYAQGKSFSKTIIWLREWYDKIGKTLSENPDEIVPTVVILGCAPEAWTAITEMSEKGKATYGEFGAFLDRIPPGNYVDLKPLSLPEVKELLDNFLSKSFAKEFTATDPLYPFDEDSAKMIFEASQGVPRFVIRCARILLRDADIEGKKITKENADRWFRKAKILVE